VGVPTYRRWSVSKSAVLVILSAFAAGCSSNASAPTAPMSVPVFSQSDAASPNANGGNFGTPLSGDEEVPANASKARGNAVFQLNAAGDAIDYQLSVANIENVFMAHIHMAPPGVIGDVVVWLYPGVTPGPGPAGGGRIDGVIARGSFTAGNLVGPLAGHPLSDLVAAIQAGNAYVNVHTSDGVDPPNTGPGDIPGGEIRSQVEHRGH
jgi:CHRD domain